MNRDFETRVRDLRAAPLSFDQVTHRARGIRRKRRAAVAGGVLAAVAVIVPSAMLIDNGAGSDDGIAPAGTPSADPTAVQVDYLAGQTWHQAGGDAKHLPATYQSAVEWNDNLVATRVADPEADVAVVDVLDPDGNVLEQFETNGQPVAANADHTTIAYVSPDGLLLTRWEGGEGALPAGEKKLRSDAAVVAVQGGPECGAGSTCSVFINNPQPAGCQQHGAGRLFQPAPIRCNDVSDDLMALVYEQSADGPCTGLRNNREGYVWQTCDWDVRDISPDEKYVAAVPAGPAGRAPAELALLDSAAAESPDVVASYDDGTVLDWAWSAEGDGLVFTSTEDGETAVRVLLPDGSVGDLSGGVAGPPEDSGLVLVR